MVRQLGRPVFKPGETSDPSAFVPARRSGGGGGSRTISDIVPVADVESQLRAKAQAKAEEQQRVQDQIKASDLATRLETERQEQIFEGTVAGQLQSQPSLSNVILQPSPTPTQTGGRPSARDFRPDKSSFVSSVFKAVTKKNPLAFGGVQDLIPAETKRKGAEALFEFAVTEPLTLQQSFEIIKGGAADRDTGKSADVGALFKGGLELTKTSVIAPLTLLKDVSSQVPGALGFPIRGASTIIPTTPFGVGTIFGGGRIIKGLSPLAKKFVFGGIGASTVPSILDEDLTAEERFGAGLIFTGAGLGTVFPTKAGLGRKAQREQLNLLVDKKFITKDTASSLAEGIKLQSFLRGQKDVPIKLNVADIIPKGITQAESEVFARTLLAEDVTIFGGKALEARGIRLSSDVDIIAKDNLRILTETQKLFEEVSFKKVTRGRGRSGGSVGVGGEKAFDIKSSDIVKEFPFSQRRVKSEEGVKFIRTSEQFSRALSGTLELRKGGKDIGDVLLASEAILKQSTQTFEGTKFPPLKGFRGFRLSKALTRFENLKGAIPQFEQLGAKGKGFEVPGVGDLKIDFGVLTFLPPGKKGRAGGFTGTSIETDLLVKDTSKLTGGKTPKFDISTFSEFKPSKTTTSKIKPPVFLGGASPSTFKTPTIESPTTSVFDIKPPTDPTPISDITPTTSKFQPPIADIDSTPIIDIITPSFAPPSRRTLRKKTPRRKTAERKLKKQPKRKRRRAVVRVRPSFTGIITAGGIRAKDITAAQFERAAPVGRRGVSPFALRGTRQGLAPPRRKSIKKKVVKKKTTKKKRSPVSRFGFTNF